MRAKNKRVYIVILLLVIVSLISVGYYICKKDFSTGVMDTNKNGRIDELKKEDITNDSESKEDEVIEKKLMTLQKMIIMKVILLISKHQKRKQIKQYMILQR